jgi:hypothetical protein
MGHVASDRGPKPTGPKDSFLPEHFNNDPFAPIQTVAAGFAPGSRREKGGG